MAVAGVSRDATMEKRSVFTGGVSDNQINKFKTLFDLYIKTNSSGYTKEMLIPESWVLIEGSGKGEDFHVIEPPDYEQQEGESVALQPKSAIPSGITVFYEGSITDQTVDKVNKILMDFVKVIEGPEKFQKSNVELQIKSLGEPNGETYLEVYLSGGKEALKAVLIEAKLVTDTVGPEERIKVIPWSTYRDYAVYPKNPEELIKLYQYLCEKEKEKLSFWQKLFK